MTTPGRPISARDLNAVESSARSAHPATGSFLAVDNGSALSLRNPRRVLPIPGRAMILQQMQWRISAIAKDSGVVVSVGPGIVAWGGGVNCLHPGEPELGPVSPGSSVRIVWTTAAPPLPLVHDPRWPTGGAPGCECPDCTCPAAEGDGSASGGDSGALLLVDDSWTMPEGTTDVREIGRVTVPDEGAPTIEQLQRDTIVALAIVGRAAGGDDPEDVPPCGNPLNGDGDYNPLDMPYDTGRGESGNPLDDEGDGGYTPSCTPEDD